MMKRTWVSYSYVIGWTLFIYVTIPLVRAFQKFIYGTVGKSAFGYFVLVVVAAGLVWSVFYLKRKRVGIKNYLWLAGVTGLYTYFTIKLWDIPEEAVHFVEYGVLSYFVYKALFHHVRDVTIYFSVAFIILFLGTIDEIIQWIVPDRFWDFKDVWLNFLSGALFQLGVWKGIRPETITEKVSPRSVRILSGTVAASLILLGLCVSTTPPRIAYISERMPAFSFLKKNENMMSETGYKHRDPEIGAFYSRFTKEGLKGIDKERSEQYARVLDENRDKKYGDFLKTYNPVTSPFLYEMRIHLFRRDRYSERGRKAEGRRQKTGEGGGRREFWTVAYMENMILERYFGETLERSVYKWPDERKREIVKEVDVEKGYESPVSKELFTRFSEKEVWGGIWGLLVMMLLANIFISHPFRSTEIP